MNRVTLVLGLVAFASTMALGQAGGRAEKPDLDLKALDCRSQWSDLDSCKSYTELLQNKDKDLLGLFKPDQHTFVCFRSEEDAFFATNWMISEFRKTSAVESRAASMIEYRLYRNGALADFHAWIGEWSKVAIQPDDEASVSITNAKNGHFYADASEVSVGYNFENRNHTTTKYSVSIRRSTGRFTESFSFPVKKGGKAEAQDQTGHCLQYPPRVTP